MTRFTLQCAASLWDASVRSLPLGRLTLIVFLAALLPRLYALGTFLTIDEVK